MKCSKFKLVIFGIIGFIFTVTGVVFCVLWSHFHGIFDNILNNKLILTPTSQAFDVWKDINDNPKIVEFYFFNWTNPEELKVMGKKPNFVEVGPYSFIKKIEKVNITFHSENHTMSYDQLKYWHFDMENSNGNLNDKIVQLNIVAVTAAHKARYLSRHYQNEVSLLFNNLSNLNFVKTVNELLFTGYTDSLTEMIEQSSKYNKKIAPPYYSGWFNMSHSSTSFDGHFNIGTGEDGLDTLGVIKNWNYQNTTSYYKSPCNGVEENIDEYWIGNRDSTEVITKWIPDFCRPVTYEYTGIVTHHGILGYQYSIDEETLGNTTKSYCRYEQSKYFENATTNEDFFDAEHSTAESSEYLDDPDTINMGRCYCNGECSPMGLINITACRYGAPGFVSLPHFYKGDPILREQVTGMDPNECDYSSYITLETKTGFPLDVAARFQFNILLQPSLIIPLFKDVPKIYFPVFWYNEKGGITEDSSRSLRQLLTLPSTIFYGSIVLAVVGTLIIIVTIIILFRRNRRSQKLEISGRSFDVLYSKKMSVPLIDRNILANERYFTDRLI